MSFPFFKPQTGNKRFAAQPQTIYSEFPLIIPIIAHCQPLGKPFSRRFLDLAEKAHCAPESIDSSLDFRYY